ncbi:MAG: hypothetical protein EA397_18320 [Deltaproteobacteria bacterium]|nr:MAG: hypothetical protein EA397_18320 [Deltaproteobacteria bacterium]
MSRLSKAGILIGALIAASGCAPQNAELTGGSYTAFLSLNTSPVFVDGSIRYEDTQEWWSFDCRDLANEDSRFEDGRIDNCRPANGVQVLDEMGARGVVHETWADRDAFIVVREELEPWRGEAVMTSEGDLNVTFHHRLPGGNFRFAFSIRPDFAPERCVDRGGDVAFEPIDGDWVTNWSRAINEPNYEGGDVVWPDGYEGGDGTLFFLNSMSYQFNPDDPTRIWSLPPKMRAGYTRARWGPEELFMTASRYGQPSAYTNFDENERGPPLNSIFYTPLDPAIYGGEGFEDSVRSATPFINMMRTVERTQAQTQMELEALYPNGADEHRPIVPSNAWRETDGRPAGFAGWGEMHYNWVRFDQDRSEIDVGNNLTGNFGLRYYGANSQSHVFVQGEFVIDRIKRDRWVTRDVHQDRLEENQTNVCGRQF